MINKQINIKNKTYILYFSNGGIHTNLEGLSKELKAGFLGDSFSGEDREAGAAEGMLGRVGVEGDELPLNLNLSNFVKKLIISGCDLIEANL